MRMYSEMNAIAVKVDVLSPDRHKNNDENITTRMKMHLLRSTIKHYATVDVENENADHDADADHQMNADGHADANDDVMATTIGSRQEPRSAR